MAHELRGIRVLLAEDDFLIATHLSTTMQAEGATVSVVDTVKELCSLDFSQFDVAVLDNNLLDGEVGAEVDRLAAAGLPLIHQSGDDDLAQARRDCFVACLGKPVTAKDLIATVSAHGRSGPPRPE